MTESACHIADIALRFPGEGAPPSFMANEQEQALKKLTEESFFQPLNDDTAPYSIGLSVQDNRLIFAMTNARQTPLPALVLSLKPYSRIIKDYFMMIESYETVRAQGSRAKLEAIDMGRRGLHNEGAEMIMTRLSDKITMDMETARGFFTLVCALQASPRLRA